MNEDLHHFEDLHHAHRAGLLVGMLQQAGIKCSTETDEEGNYLNLVTIHSHNQYDFERDLQIKVLP